MGIGAIRRHYPGADAEYQPEAVVAEVVVEVVQETAAELPTIQEAPAPVVGKRFAPVFQDEA